MLVTPRDSRRLSRLLAWREQEAQVLLSTYVLLLLLSSFCLATGFFHASGIHHHSGDKTDQPALSLDPCQVVFLALTTCVSGSGDVPLVVSPRAETLPVPVVVLVFPEPATPAAIRAPPCALV